MTWFQDGPGEMGVGSFECPDLVRDPLAGAPPWCAMAGGDRRRDGGGRASGGVRG